MTVVWHGELVEYDDNADWLAKRRGMLGASDVAAAAGVSPFDSPYSLWAQKVGATNGFKDSEWLKWGTLLEAAIRREAAKRLEVEVVGVAALVRHPEFEWCSATLDGVTVPKGYETEPWVDGVQVSSALLEVKNVGSLSEWDEIPEHYRVQGQWQMFVTGLPKVWFAVLHGGHRLVLYPMDADPVLQGALFEAAEQFWFDYVVAEVPPPVDGSEHTWDAARDVFGEVDDDGEVELEESAVRVLREIRRLGAEAKRLETAQRALKSEVLTEYVKEARYGTFRGVRVVSAPTVGLRRPDVELLKEKYPLVYEDVCRTSSYRRLMPLKALEKEKRVD